MGKEKKVKQKDVDVVWGSEWDRMNKNKELGEVFRSKLFIEGSPIYRKYIPENPKMILDVGAGTGKYGVIYAKEFLESTVYITDVIEESLDIIRRLTKEVGVENNTVIQKEDISKFTFEDNMFDVVMCDAVIQHVPDVNSAMKEIYRVLKPGGIVFISTMNVLNFHSLYKLYLRLCRKEYEYVNEKSYTPRELKKLFKTYNFEVVAQDGFSVAYGIFRLKKDHKIFAHIGHKMNKVTKFIDRFTGRFLSKKLGFEIFVVGRKK
ncbi:MAG: class I SAM-dependent methyltransferase [Candidatus Pacebacteria bacterium]|nr:class I SAM-dependent methyltransferase [Candidatus Paceibacterota bacterium]